MICPTCQLEIEDGAASCRACGQVLSDEGGELKLGSLVADRYQVLELLGRGGMGVVYKAHDRLLEETVALKVLRREVLSTELARRFREEIRLARRVSHRNVCRIHEYGETEGLRYISMAFVDGVDLKRVLRRQGPLPPEDALSVARDSAAGLQAIHDEGIIHRDLKTANIMRDTRGVVRLMDFGIAKSSDASSGMTATGAIVGTPDYMSPEQATGAGLDARSDVYSLGVVLYELLTARVPFHADTPMATLLRHIQEPLRLDVGEAARIPPSVRPVLERSMAKSPGDRFASARDLGEALARLEATLAPAPSESGTATVGRSALAVASPTPSPRTRSAPTPVPAPTAEREPPVTGWQGVTATRSGGQAARPPGPPRWLAIALPLAGVIGVGLVVAILYLARTIAEGRQRPLAVASPAGPSAAPTPPLSDSRPRSPQGPAVSTPSLPPPPTARPQPSATSLAGAAKPASPAASPPTTGAPTQEPARSSAIAPADPGAAAWAEVLKAAEDASRPPADRLALVSRFINENPPSHPHRVDADRLLSRISDEASRQRLLLPPDPSTLGRLRRAVYVGGTHGELSDGTEGSLAFDRERTLFLVEGDQRRFVVIPYKGVTGIDYGLTDHIRGLMFKKKSHYVSLTYKDPSGDAQGMVLELGPDDFRPVLTQLEARTGQKVKYQDEKAAKERWR
jgi:serine/threonine protein kinase